ncbi:MAG: GSCFA domain-containing protein [Muribaculaceae bacterium]|nr:GSCFA domain-containing protein [Muribaculaceae bacterium]
MDFRTTIRMGDNQGLLHHSDALLLIGSCFSDNIGAKLHSAMMQVDVNPFGTLFNPMSIAQGVSQLISGSPIAGMTLFQQNGVWNSYAFHSRYSRADKEQALDVMNRHIADGHRHLQSCQALVVTLGTAMTYRLKATGEVVANCHKVPQHEFERGIASVAEMTRVLDEMVTAVRNFNPQAHIIFTVSPIRHIADGLDVNALSKARLRVAIDDVMTRHTQSTLYFPAFEIMTDDLRDYRFYAADMVHPSEVAIEYIWQAFQATYFDDRSAQAIARCERVSKRLQHRPMSNNRDVVERFNADTQAVLRNLLREYPYLKNSEEFKTKYHTSY